MAYKISVNIQIQETDELPNDNAPIRINPGSFDLNISSSRAKNIDQCEKALLEVNSVTLRDALSSHLSQESEKEAQQSMPGFVKKTV
jgi:hypothetical protein